MKKILIIIGLILGESCAQQSNDKSSQETYPKQNPQAGLPCIDSTINGILRLNNEESIINSIGDLYSKLNNPDNESPNIFLKNKSESEYLKMIKWEGSGRNYFSYFVVGKIIEKSGESILYPTSFVTFKTECGIHLGLIEDSLILIKGTDYKVSREEKNEVLTYSNKDLYVAKYYFNDGRIVKYEFGFEYP